MNVREKFQKSIVRFKRGEVIFQEGELGTEMYIIQSGKVRIYKEMEGAQQTLAIFEKGDFFGEMAILEGLPRTATAVAEEDCELIRVNSANFVQMIRVNPEIAIRIMRKLSTRLRETTEQLRKLYQVQTAILGAYDAPPQPKPAETEAEEKKKRKALAYLVSKLTGRTYPITKETVIIGRYDRVTGQRPDIDLSDEDPNRYISRRHAIILYEDNQWKLIEEIGVVNGTYLNKQRLPNGVPVPLNDGDQIVFANVPMTFHIAPDTS